MLKTVSSPAQFLVAAFLVTIQACSDGETAPRSPQDASTDAQDSATVDAASDIEQDSTDGTGGGEDATEPPPDGAEEDSAPTDAGGD